MKRADITDRMVCEACRDRETTGMPADAILVQRTGAPPKVIQLAMERSHDRGLIEFGVSLRTAWVTDSGHLLLESGD